MINSELMVVTEISMEGILRYLLLDQDNWNKDNRLARTIFTLNLPTLLVYLLQQCMVNMNDP